MKTFTYLLRDWLLLCIATLIISYTAMVVIYVFSFYALKVLYWVFPAIKNMEM